MILAPSLLAQLLAGRRALRLALPHLRADVEADINGAWIFAEASGGGLAPNPAARHRQRGECAVDAADVARVEAKLDAIGAAEACVGRQPDGAPAWLDDIIDGRRPL